MANLLGSLFAISLPGTTANFFFYANSIDADDDYGSSGGDDDERPHPPYWLSYKY